MSGSKVIQDEEQYEKARKAMLLIAGELDDPISDLTPDERARKHLIYDRTVELIAAVPQRAERERTSFI